MTLLRFVMMGLLMSAVACELPMEPESDSRLDSIEQPVKGGRVMAPDEKPGIGGITGGTGFCSGTLISKDQVITAAHCVCDSDGCPQRAGIWFRSPINTTPGDNPAVFIDGDVVVHPAYDHYENHTDLAIINLDREAPALAGEPYGIPKTKYHSSSWVQIVGRAPNGNDCRWRDDDYGFNILWAQIDKYANGNRTVQFNDNPTCKGDSGGPVLRGRQVVGVNSGSQWTFSDGWVSKAVSTAYYYDWIREQVCGTDVWSQCSDHSPICQCPAGVGDCDSSADCQSTLRCGRDNGASFGYSASVDVCVPEFGPQEGTCVCTTTGLGNICSSDVSRNECAAGYKPSCSPQVGACGGCDCIPI